MNADIIKLVTASGGTAVVAVVALWLWHIDRAETRAAVKSICTTEISARADALRDLLERLDSCYAQCERASTLEDRLIVLPKETYARMQ